MKKKLRILVSNDDGVHAQGLKILVDTLREFAEVDIAAPDRNRSGASNSLTLDAPIFVKKIASNVLSVEGTPTDCVHLAITGLLKHDPDMVVSGINEQSNLGDDVLYSGTVAAAIEGRYLGKPAIAVSLVNRGKNHFNTAATVTKLIVKRLISDPLPAGTILNVNVPDVAISKIQGFEVTRLGSRHRAEPTIKQIDPRGRKVYWIGLAGAEQDAGPGTDFYAINRNKVSITPLQVDLTAYKAFDQLAKWLKGMRSD
jgi:5'-nucleotidase